MNYKVIGETNNGRCSCGHRVHKGESYVIVRLKFGLRSMCANCGSIYKTISIKANQVRTLR